MNPHDLTPGQARLLLRLAVLGLKTLAERGDLPATTDWRPALYLLHDLADTDQVPGPEPAHPPAATLDRVTGIADEAARRGCSTSYARRLARAGKLPGARLVGGRWIVPNHGEEEAA